MFWKTIGNTKSSYNRKTIIQSSLHVMGVIAILMAVVVSVFNFLPANAATTLTVKPITWNVIGLDSNDVNVGPNQFPVGVRVCNMGTSPATNVTANFVWDSSNAYVNIRPGTSPTLSVPTLAVGACTDFYFEIEVTRNVNAYGTSRRYHIEVTESGTPGTTWNTPVPRELYVERLISQSRNATADIKISSTGLPGSFTSVPPKGVMTLFVGNTYWIELTGFTATNGYEQIETFINMPNTIFQVIAVTTDYTADTSGNVSDPSDMLYGDGCIWVDNPLSPNYRSCLNVGKVGGNISVTYQVKIISMPTAPLLNPEALRALTYDYSGSSYHYNADFYASTRYVEIGDPGMLTIVKNFSPDPIGASGISTLTFTISNPYNTSISNANFVDIFPTSPAAMTLANNTLQNTCGGQVQDNFGGALGSGDVGIRLIDGILPANGVCSITVYVTAPTAGTYTNTYNAVTNPNHLYIGTIDTGSYPSDTLTVTTAPIPPTPPLTCISPVQLAYWDFAGFSTAYTTKASDVSTATASFVSSNGGTSGFGVSKSNGNLTTAWWGTSNTAGTGWNETPASSASYFQFQLDTSKYNGVYVVFDADPDNGGDWANPQSRVFVKSSTDGLNFSTYVYSPNPDAPYPVTYLKSTKGIWTNSLSALAATTGTGSTYFRFSVDGSTKNIAAFYLDNVRFMGCRRPLPPTVIKSFSPDPVSVGGTSTLTLTITNPNPSGQSLTGIAISDYLPWDELVGTVAVTNGSSAVVGTDTAFTTQLAVNSIIAIPSTPVNLTGTISVTLGSSTVTGSGTFFNTELAVGKIISINGVNYTVVAIGGNTSLTLARIYRGTTASGLTAATYKTYTVSAISDDTHLTLSTPYAGTTAGNLSISSGLTLTSTPTTTCGSQVIGTTGNRAVSLTGGNLTGTLAFTNGSTTVTGTGTSFNSQLGAGSILVTPYQPTGSVAVTNGSVLVTGTGTSFLTQLSIGSRITINSVDYIVNGIIDNTSLSLTTAYTGTTASGLTVRGYREYTVASVNSATSLTLATAYSSAANLSGLNITAGVAGGATCTITATVKANLAGTRTNITGVITAPASGENATSSGYASANLTAVVPPVIVKSFKPDLIPVGGTSSLTFIITNLNTLPMTNVAFTDTLPAGVDVTNSASTQCGGTLTTTDNAPNPDSIALTGGTIAANSSCTIIVNVTGTSIGTKTNVTGTVTGSVSSVLLTGNTATDTLVVRALMPGISLMKQVSTSSSGPWYDSVIIPAGATVYYKFTIENTGEAPLSPVSVIDPTVSTAGCTWPASLPVAVAGNDNHIATCVVNVVTPIIAVDGYTTNTAHSQGTYGGTIYTSNNDSASYLNGNFGHLPSAYLNMNMFNDGGAMQLNGSTYLGTRRPGLGTDPGEADGINMTNYNSQATDDGVTWTGSWNTGTGTASVIATCDPAGTKTLWGWFDWNNDIDFDDPLEAQSWTVPCSPIGTTSSITIDYPGAGNLAAGTFYVRFRIYDTTPTAPSALGASYLAGEIEDFFIRSDGSGGTPTPVTLSYFKTEDQGDQVLFTWSTATETGNLGFNLYVQSGGRLIPVNDGLIPSSSIDSLDPQDYSYTAKVNGTVFYIEDVDVTGDVRRYGPFDMGEEYGFVDELQPVDWEAIDTGTTSSNETLSDFTLAGGRKNTLQFKTNQTGMVHLTYEELRDAGLDLNEIRPANISVSAGGKAVPIYVTAKTGWFGPGNYIEFHAKALNTLYTDTNVYTIRFSSASSPFIKVNSSALPATIKPVASYNETILVNNQRRYATYLPGSDPWYDNYVFVQKSASSLDTPFEVQGLANSTSNASLNLVVWGMVDLSQKLDHHIQVSINGVPVADEWFDGLVEKTVNVTIPAGTLKEGTNILTLTLPADTGAVYDLVYMDKFRVTYRRLFNAVDGKLTFTAAGKTFRVKNLPTENVVVYRLENNRPVRISQVKIKANGTGYTATFPGSLTKYTYLVSTVESMVSPSLSVKPPSPSLDTPAEYLIISHPVFMDGLQPLVDARQAQGLTVNVVNVEDLYRKYTYGVFDPKAIKDYISYAARNLGTEYVLLVGGDTYDYRNYLGLNSISFIPSLYTGTSPLVKFVPADPLYADYTGDNVPDLAIGRFPVRTLDELNLMITKTLAYQNKDYGRTAVFASDRMDGFLSFKNISTSMSTSLPSDWNVENIHLDTQSVTSAQTQLLSAMNRGTALVNYTGHSGAFLWTSSGLFGTKNAASLTNAGRPFVVIQWGCWNTYYVEPRYTYLVQSLLFSGDQGAAAVLGASTLTDAYSEELLGRLLMPRLVNPGTTMGQALLDAKQALAQTHPEMLDVILGWTLMGDPALVVEP